MENSETKTSMLKKVPWTTVGLVLAFIMGVALLGCSSVMDKVTPAPYNPLVGDYLEQDVPQFMGFTTLDIAKNMANRANRKHRDTLVLLKRDIEDNETGHKDTITFLTNAIEDSKKFQDVVIGSEGNPFSIAGLLATAAPGLLIGLNIKRKQDKSPEQLKEFAKDVEKRAIAKFKAEAAAALAS